MKKMILLALCALTFAACGSSNSSSSKNNGGGRPPNQEELKDATDYSACNQGVRSSIEGRWQHQMSSEHFTTGFTFEISRGSTRLSNECTDGMHSVVASIQVPSTYTENTFSILRADQDSEKNEGADYRINCDVSIQAKTMSYRMNGACLVLQMDGQSITLVPGN
jgi:hypothetical protein